MTVRGVFIPIGDIKLSVWSPFRATEEHLILATKVDVADGVEQLNLSPEMLF